MHSSRQLSLNPTQNHQQKTTLLTPLITTTALCKGGEGVGWGGWREEGGRGVRQQLCAKRKGRGWGIRHDKRFVQGWRVGRVGINQITAVCGGGGGIRKQLCVCVWGGVLGGGIRCDNSFVQGWVHPTQDIKGDTLHENTPLSQLGFQTLPSLSSQTHTSMGSP